jgi:hypothetical protein
MVIAYLFTGLLIDGSPKKNPTTKEVGNKIQECASPKVRQAS